MFSIGFKKQQKKPDQLRAWAVARQGTANFRVFKN